MREEKIYWTYHVNMRLKGRFIPRQTIVESVDNYEIIEEYPDDKYLPSYLVYSQYQGLPFHALFATDVPGDNIRMRQENGVFRMSRSCSAGSQRYASSTLRGALV